MVPHRKILRVIALVAHCSADPETTRQALEVEYRVKFPKDFKAFWTNEVLSWLSPAVEALLLTTDFKAVRSYDPAFKAAAELKLNRYITLGPSGLQMNIPDVLRRWRRHEQIRVCLETMLLCALNESQIVSDIRRMYGISIDENQVSEFGQLFVDKDFIEGDPWLEYMECIGTDEAQFKFRLMQAPKDYARYKLGVPVHLNDEEVLDRLMSDSYFAAVEMRIEGQNITAADLARVKLERETIFKAMDRRLKIREAKNSSGDGGASEAAKQMGLIILDYQDQDLPLMSDVMKEEKPKDG
jgi:hypothetical protein